MNDKAIIFDMDGVLIDSEPAYLEMNKKLFKQFGIVMDDEDYNALVGMPSLPMWTMLKEKYDLKNEVSDFLNMEKNRMNEILDSNLITEPVKGILSLLELLKKKNYKLSVASSSAKENINFVLEKLSLGVYFDFVISGEEVKNGKPAPDIFLKVAEEFSINNSKCFVIEDSNNGVKAAGGAGMKSIGFKNNNTNLQDLDDADIIVQNFVGEDLQKILNFIGKN
ncbi:MAG: HAD family phosphatase [Ignavibacteria bacterium]